MPGAELKIHSHHPVFFAEQAVPPAIKIGEPLPPHSPECRPEPQYLTQWRGYATLEEILTDKNVRNVAFAKMRSFGYTDQDAEDCFQLGSINFWKALKEQPTVLIDKRAAWAGVWIALSGSRRTLWKHKARCVPLDDPDKRIGRPERWAGFATRIDEQIDFMLLLNTLAQRYDGDALKLYAMYALTTSVATKDVISLLSVTKEQMTDAQDTVREEMRELLELDIPKELAEKALIGQIKQGENLDCVARVAEKVIDNQRLLLALYIVTTCTTRKDVIELFGIGRTAFRKEISQIKAMLVEEFRKTKRKLDVALR